jgi:hypothetical protein
MPLLLDVVVIFFGPNRGVNSKRVIF